MAAGRHTQPAEPLAAARQRCAGDLVRLAPSHLRLRDPQALVAGHTLELLAYARDAGP